MRPLRLLPPAVLAGLALAPAAPAAPSSQVSGACPAVPVYAWQGSFVERRVTVVRRTDGARLEATLFRPADRRRHPGRRAAVVLMHGLNGNQCGQFWAARSLAGEGYVALAISAGSGLEPKVAALSSGIGFLRSRANPLRRMTRGDRIGAAGHSQGATAVALAQARDRRIGAIVAFDNLRAFENGDRGVWLGCRGRPRDPITPRVPAMGQASDVPCVNRPDRTPPDLKKPGFEAWRAAGLPTMEIVFAGTEHADWGGRRAGGGNEAGKRRLFSHYATAWFDRFLLGRRAAARRLLARRVAGAATTSILSSRFRSGAAFPGARGCADDLRDCL